MDTYYYAQLDESNICIGISQLSGEVNQANMIRLADYDMSLISKKYDNGTWEEVEQPEPPQPQQTYTDTQLVMQALVDQELRDLQAQAERQMIAQQQTDIEITLMGVTTNV